MKLFYRLIKLIILTSLLISSCSGQEPPKTQAPVISKPTATSPTLPPMPTSTPTLVPLQLPLIYIAIDESTSMKKDDCDTNYYRYKVPSFLLNVVKSLGDEFKPVDGSPTPNLMLAEGGGGIVAANPPIRLVSGDQAADEIKNLLKGPRSFENHPFIPVLNTYKSNLSQSPRSVLFFFTDGDFTGLSSVINPKTLANDVERRFRNIHTEFPDAKMYIFLLCAGRFKNASPSSDYPDIKQTWDDISTYKYATVYGLGQDKMIPNDSETGVFLKQLLDTVFRDQGLPENSDPSPESSWGWGFLNQGPDRFLYVYPPTVRLKLDSVSFDKNATPPSVLLDGKELDRSFVPPAKECGLHELRITDPPPLTFYWWEADTPQFSLEKVSWRLADGLKNLQATAFLSPPVMFYNSYLTTINTNIALKSSWDHIDLPTTNPLLNYKNCMKFQAHVNDGEWNDMTPSGDFLLANPSPDKPASPVNVEYQSVWKGVNNINIVTASVLSPGEEWALYYPQYIPSISIIDNASFVNLNIKFTLAFNFLADSYYPNGSNYQANPGFTDPDCPVDPVGGPVPYGFNWELTPQQGAIVTLIPAGKDKGAKWVNCKNFEVGWTTTLSTGEGWVGPGKLKIACVLHWHNDDNIADGVYLDSIECKQGEE